MVRRVCLAAAVVGLAGCSLIDSPMGEVDLELPARSVTIDTADWQLTDQGKFPSVTCIESPNVCASSAASWCGASELCAPTCGGGTCEVNVEISLWHTFNLAEELAELQEIDGRPLVQVVVDRVAFAVRDNTLSVDSPALTVSVAPQGVMVTDGRDAGVVGTIPPVESGEKVAEAELELAPDGLAALAERIQDYETPFNLIVGSNVRLAAGDDVPTGRLVTTILVSAHATTGL